MNPPNLLTIPCELMNDLFDIRILPVLLSPSCSLTSPPFDYSTTPPLCDTWASTIDSLLIQSHYFPKHGPTVRLPLNHLQA